MSKPSLYLIHRNMKIALEAFQAVDTLASTNFEAGIGPEISKALVPANFLLEEAIRDLEMNYVKLRTVEEVTDSIEANTPGLLKAIKAGKFKVYDGGLPKNEK
ncbi:MAG: hypothetical protein ACI9Y1_000793 [Lentisphaeria bacterium]|jgi:hypothetical protein